MNTSGVPSGIAHFDGIPSAIKRAVTPVAYQAQLTLFHKCSSAVLISAGTFNRRFTLSWYILVFFGKKGTQEKIGKRGRGKHVVAVLSLHQLVVLIITRVEMYVCFGFSLARLSRARTIDLQCQSLSLRRAFLLRSVCLSCMSVSVSRSLAYVEQGRSTCNVNRYLSVELFCFAACACHCT